MKIKIKETYLLIVIVLGLFMIASYSTFALFTASAEIDDVVEFNASLTTNSSILEYEMVKVPAGESKIIEVRINNTYTSSLYYGAWYEVLYPENSSDVSVGLYTEENSNSSSGQLTSNGNITLLVGISNSTSEESIVNIGTVGSLTSNLGIESPRVLLSSGWEPASSSDFTITNVLVNNVSTNSVGNSLYSLTSNCSNVSYDRLSGDITFSNFTGKQSCSLSFTSDTNYPLLSTMNVGDYVAYEGNNGCLKGKSDVTGNSSAVAKSGNSCLGENANQSSDSSGYTYGYCYSSGYSFYVYGWRIAYIEDGKVHLISAGAPECLPTGYNLDAEKYCNSTYADGGTCTSSNAWALNNDDFNKITFEISGTASDIDYCSHRYSLKRCGYNNDLLDNGGDYKFNYVYVDDDGDSHKYIWLSDGRIVSSYTTDFAFGVRPVIKLSSSVYVTGGSGTMDDPYTIGI